MLNLQPGTFEAFASSAARGNVVAVVRTVLADLQTPVGAFLRLGQDAPYAFMLESAEGGERVARYSFVGANPEMVVRGLGSRTLIEIAGEQMTERDQCAHAFLREHFRARRLASAGGLPPLAGGAVGFFSYEAARWFEPLLEGAFGVESDQLDAIWMFYRTMLAFDRVRQQMFITSLVFTEEADGSRIRLRELYERAVEETERIEKLLETPHALTESEPFEAEDACAQFQPDWPRLRFEHSVRAVREQIAAGECYTATLSAKFRKRLEADPLSIYRALRATNPSPYMYLMRLNEEWVMGASAEMLIRCRGQRLDYRALSGARRRGATETEDWLLGEEMRADEGEIARHALLIDVGRNDLGRVADYGSVEVGELMTLERYPHAQHLVTHLRARLRDGLDGFDALASCFPSISLTGAPKARAMQVLSELEPESRGAYAGAIAYADYAGNLDSCAAARMITIKENEATVHACAVVVADSVPERVYDETLNEARALVHAIGMAEKGL